MDYFSYRDREQAFTAMKRENQQLLTQVKRLARAERNMIELQDQMNDQIKLYRQLNDLVKRCKPTLVTREILQMAIEFLVYDLNFERCLVLAAVTPDHTVLPDDTAAQEQREKSYQALIWEGYDDDDPIGQVQLAEADWQFQRCLQAHECVISLPQQPVRPGLGQAIGMDEFILMAIQSHDQQLQYIICLGNRADQAHLFSAVSQDGAYLVVLLNLLGHLSSTIEQARLYRATLHQAETLRTTIAQLKSTQSQLIQTEKMSSLGQLVAGIAHEINNPVNFIHGNISHAVNYASNLLKLVELYQAQDTAPAPAIVQALADLDFEFVKADLPLVMQSMEMGTTRIQEIVLSLRNFSRMDEAEVKTVDLHEGLESTLLILQHRLKRTRDRPEVQLVKAYGEIQPIECAAGLVNQVFMNLFSNAIDATESATIQGLIPQPQIEIRTQNAPEGGVFVSIIDNGGGVPEAIQTRLFDPFFTTKPIGKGTGLGLSISYQIITEKHQGKLECFSTQGQGTEFRIWLPTSMTI